ncbi:hypothetical protein ACEPAG_8466 [Sanghuangporus baumii]
MPGIVVSREDTPPVLLTSAQLKAPPTFGEAKSDLFSFQRFSRSSLSSALSSPPPSIPQDLHIMDKPSHRVLHKGRAIPKDVPIARPTEENQSAFGTSSSYVFRRAREGRKVIIGPMPVGTFLDEFLPRAPDVTRMPDSAAAFADVPLNPVAENDIYEPLASAINEEKRCPSIDFRITADGAGVRDHRSLEPSICGYSHQDIPFLPQLPTNGNGECEPNLGLAEISAVVTKDNDPFCDHHCHDRHSKTIHKSFFAFENHRYQRAEDFEIGSRERANLGWVVSCASEVCARQHRIFCFTILFIGTRARFFRWDRAGGIVTSSFDYTKHPDLLCEFLWRFHHANPIERGFDPTVTIASRTEEELFRDLIRKHAALQLGISEDKTQELDEALGHHYEKGKVSKLEVYERGRRMPRVFLVSVPSTSPRSVAGRSTRAYWAVELTGSNDGEVRFLKDCWRIDMDSMRDEGNVYCELEEGKVANVCHLETFGDVPDFEMVSRKEEGSISKTHFQRNTNNAETPMEPGTGRVPGQCTRTNEYIEASWVCECLRENLCAHVSRHTHCRVVLKQAGYSLRTFRGSRELFDGARGALEALDSAYKRCRRIHRDVSLDNIILYRSVASEPRRGLLVDWEFSTLVDENGKAMDDLRCGTWAFMSARALRSRRDFRHTIEDDMESLFYVVMYGCLRWLPHKDVPRLGKWIRRFFDEAVEYGDGRDIGGLDKIINQAGRGSDFREAFQFPNEFVQAWFDIGYDYLATSHVLHRDSGSKLLWTTRNLRQLFGAICNGLAAQEEAEQDRMNHDMQGYLAAAEDHHGMHTSLLAGAIEFHAARAQELVASRQVLDEAISGFDRPIDTRPDDLNRRSRKRRRCSKQVETDVIRYFGTRDQSPKPNRATKKRKMNSVRSTQSDTALDSNIANTYDLRSRRGRGCCSVSDYGIRRSARLASKRSEPSSMATRRHQ